MVQIWVFTSSRKSWKNSECLVWVLVWKINEKIIRISLDMQRMFEKLSSGFSRYNARLQTVFEITTKVSFSTCSKYVGQGSAVVEC
jgi:hypothetical protein